MGASTLLDREALKDWIAKRLGEPVQKVELSEDHYNDAIDAAYQWYLVRKGVTVTSSLSIVAGQTEYTLPSDVNAISDVALPADSGTPLAYLYEPYSWFLPEQQAFPVGRAWHSPTSLPYSNILQLQQYGEMARRASSNDPTWYQVGNKLIVSPPPLVGGTAKIEYTTKNFTIEQIPVRDHEMLKKYALAFAMMDLGMIRTKYDSYPTAQGTVQLNGQLLIDRAQGMMDALDVEIKQSSAPFAILVG